MKTKNIINISVVGCGRIAQKHVQAIDALKTEGVRIISASDIRLERIDSLNLSSDVIRSENCNDPKLFDGVDLGVVLTESGNHFQNAKMFLEKDIDVLIEKPVTLRLDHAYELRKISRERDRKIYVVKQNRFNKPIQIGKDFVNKGYLGDPQIATVRVRWCRPQEYYDLATWRGTWLMDGGVISNQASHHIDLLRWFMGEVRSVRAIAKTFSAKIEAEDTIVAIIEFENGAVGTVEATTSTRPKNLEGSLSIQGNLGAFEVAGFAVNELRYLQSAHVNFKPNEFEVQDSADANTTDVYGSGHKEVYSQILADRLGKPASVVLIDEAIKSLELIHLIYMSVEQKRSISLSELGSGSNRLGY